jgi:putative spermidine/putrescine transport system substrate-binding protein
MSSVETRSGRLSRRGFLTLGLGAAAAMAAGCGGVNPFGGAKQPVKIVWAGQGGSYLEGIKKVVWEEFGKANNVEFEFVAVPTTPLLARLRAEKEAPTLDFVSTGEGVAVAMRAEGLFEKIDPSAVPNLKFIVPGAKNAENYPPQQFGIANVVYYHAEKVKEPPTSWNDMWRPDYKGRVAFPDIQNTTGLHLLLIAAKLAAGDASKQSGERHVNDAAWAKMKEILPNVYTIYGFQTAFDGMATLRSGETWLHMDGLAGQRTTVLNQAGTPIKAMVSPKEGIPNSPLTLGIVKGTKVPMEILHKLVDFNLKKEVQIGIAEATDFVPTHDMEYPPSLVGQIPKPADMLASDWKYITDNRPTWTDRWNKEILAK